MGKKSAQSHEKRFKRLGLKVREARTRKKMTLEDVEDAGYPSWRHLQKIEAGKPCSVASLFRIADSLGVRVGEFFKE